MTRVPEPTRDQLDPEVRELYDRIARTRGATRGPYVVLLHHPALCERVAALGELLRFESGLPGADRELAILTAGREAEAPYEWAAHEPVALREGTRTEAIAVVREDRPTHGLRPREAVIVDTVRAIYRARGLTADQFARADDGARTPGPDRARDARGLLRDDRRDPQRRTRWIYLPARPPSFGRRAGGEASPERR